MDQFDESSPSSDGASNVAVTSPVNEDDQIVTGPELDAWLKISPTTRWRWTRSGILPAPKRLHPHGPNIYRKREIRALIDSAPSVEIYQTRNDQLHKKQPK